MSSSINTVSISGNLTRDAELRRTGGGMEVLSFAVAVNERRKNQQTGEWEDRPSYIDCTVFGSRAGKLAGYLTKGTKVAVCGKLRQDRWDDQQGNKRSAVKVIVDDLEFMSRQQPAQAYQQPAQAYTPPEQGTFVYDADIPF